MSHKLFRLIIGYTCNVYITKERFTYRGCEKYYWNILLPNKLLANKLLLIVLIVLSQC